MPVNAGKKRLPANRDRGLGLPIHGMRFAHKIAEGPQVLRRNS
jgi:hypothetical protein